MESTIVLGGGCFWCTEAALQRVPGVIEVISGYSGGGHDTATYEEVSTGATDHAEVIKVAFEDSQVSTQKLLEIFFAIHDPTTLNQQGADKGSQYRSVIFYTSQEQKKIIESYIKVLTENKVFKDPIVTEVREFKAFYPAELYHQNFYNNNPKYGYCTVVINPKLKKLNEVLSLNN